ncbi:MAG: hydroxymyristoyl-ACP dehydratase [Treponema sp.]|nr:hydroxymyristoyl-ACP dehydratase [Spirochaetia bacterium]MDD7611398.1 hydroxymyristoyl-ACP dehydratase [Spirochaetales bacterium]MDY4524261.1 hydroxymyristoyl-ACP dehydratase [Treponema sp.]MDY4831850.1 hydroxymyristoyl-ACP dehydratase [Treponema sp.]MDY5914434.1 hydroxymyristoyl-ACP dehydratase [Treponema sp.]
MKETNLHDIKDEQIISKEEGKVVLEFVIPASSDFFDGHFPEYKLLPAVAQFEVVTRFSRKYFGTQRWVPSIKRIKFSAPIRPDTKIHLELTYKAEKQSVTFNLSDANVEGKVYSSGTFNVLSE